MRVGVDALESACRRARLLGGLVAVGLPALAAGLAFGGIVPPGAHSPEGSFLSLGHTFTGLVFLSAAWILWRRGRVLATFHKVEASLRPRVVLRESLMYAALAGASSLYGLIYWSLVGLHAARHAVGFIALGPVLFLVLLPRPEAWRKALEGAP